MTQESKPSSTSKTDGPVTIVFERVPKKDKVAEFRSWYKNLIKLSQIQPGHLETKVLEQGHRLICIQRFETMQNLSDWLESDTRRNQLSRLEELTDQAPEPIMTTNPEVWLSLTDIVSKPVKRWKSSLVMMVIIYLLVLILNLILVPLLVDLPLPVRILPFPIIITLLLTYVIMPRVTKMLRNWLQS